MSALVRLIGPSNENRSVPIRPTNAELRSREYLTEAEVEKLIKAARVGRYGHRDATLILTAFRQVSGRPRYVIWNGRRSNSANRLRCMSGASRMASHPFTRSAATS